MTRYLLFLPPLLFAGMAALFLLGMGRDNPDALPSAIAGRPAPALTLEPFAEGPALTDAMIRGPGVKLVNFWASWCAPCRAEHPILTELAAEGIPIYGINYKDTPAQALKFLGDLGNPFAAIGVDAGRMAIDWGVYGVPETFVIDAQGAVVLRFAGPITRAELERTIRPALATAAAAP